jgi:hypothetical protein
MWRYIRSVKYISKINAFANISLHFIGINFFQVYILQIEYTATSKNILQTNV